MTRRRKGRRREQPKSKAKAGLLIGAPGTPVEGSDAGDAGDLRRARTLGVIRGYRSAANRHFAYAQRLAGNAPAAAEAQARRAIDSAVRAFWWAEDDDLEEAQHKLMHQIGRWTREHFGCHLEYDGANYNRVCPIDIAHSRMGLSIGFTGKRMCSICGQDLSECPHMRERSYWVRGGPGPSGYCAVCLQEACAHRPDRLYRAGVVSMVTEIKAREVSWVSRPANPEARLKAWPEPSAKFARKFGAKFYPGVPISCNKCLGGCWGFDETLPEALSPGAPVGSVIAATMTEDGVVDLGIEMP